MCKIWLIIFFYVISVLEINGNQNEFDASYEDLKNTIQEFYRNGKEPSHLRELARTYQLTNIFRHDGPRIDKKITCDLCPFISNLVIDLRKNTSLSKEFYVDTTILLCSILGVEAPAVCEGTIHLNSDIFFYIIDNKDNINGKQVCSTIFQDYDCISESFYNWTINVPDGESPEKPKPQPGDPTFNILHISDIHFDPLYTPGGKAKCGEPLCCQPDQDVSENDTETCGYWLDYINADTPWHTLLEVLQQTKTHDFDFVYYTGDIIGHRVWSTSVANNTRDIKKIFDELKNQYNVSVYPVLGNHESNPLDVFAPLHINQSSITTSWLFNLMAEELSYWLPEDALNTIRKGGYYTVQPKPNFRIIAINSNVCYTVNWWILYDDYDQYGQLQWLVSVLEEAEKQNESVHIIAHVPSGLDSCLAVWGRAFVKIVNRFANTITGIFNGHTHRDEFHLFYNLTSPNQTVGVSYNGASITSYSLSNPSYKIYSVDKETYKLIDYDEWTFNLTQANAKSKIEWYKLYSFREAYAVEDLSSEQIGNLVYRMAQNQTLLDQYYRFKYRNGDLALQQGCNKKCHEDNLCSMARPAWGLRDQCEELINIYDNNYS